MLPTRAAVKYHKKYGVRNKYSRKKLIPLNAFIENGRYIIDQTISNISVRLKNLQTAKSIPLSSTVFSRKNLKP